jgi:hypothetical protein
MSDIEETKRCTVLYDPAIKPYFAALSPQSKQAIRQLIDAIARCPELGDCVDSLPGVKYQKSYDVSKLEFDHGIRAFYITQDDKGLVAIIDLGDHVDSARRRGYSVYPDEAARQHSQPRKAIA